MIWSGYRRLKKGAAHPADGDTPKRLLLVPEKDTTGAEK